jgi:Flp pilus assembly protein TadB
MDRLPESPELIGVLRELSTSHQQIAQALTKLAVEYAEENHRRREEQKALAAKFENYEERVWKPGPMQPIPWFFKAFWFLLCITLVLAILHLTIALLSQSWGNG